MSASAASTETHCPFESDCTFMKTVQERPLMKIKYASFRAYCREGGHPRCARYQARQLGGAAADNLLPNGDLDPTLTGRTNRVLVVDDIPVFRSLLERIVGGIVDPVEIHTADSGYGALQLTSIHEFDLVVTDYNMPGMDGAELVQALRARASTAETPIIVFTSEEPGEKSRACLGHPRVRWVQKTPNNVEIATAIRELLLEGRA